MDGRQISGYYGDDLRFVNDWMINGNSEEWSLGIMKFGLLLIRR